MILTTGRTLLVLALALALPALAQAPAPIRIDGAAAGAALAKAAAAEFGKAKVALGVSGSAGGLLKLCRGEIDIAPATRPIAKDELAACKQGGTEFIELPVAMDAITVIVNPRNRFVESLSVEELRAMWRKDAQGKVVRWSQVNPAFPDAPLKLLGPDAKFEHASTFTEAILGAGQPARGDYMTSVEDSVLIQGVARDPNALSYVPYAAYLENRSRLKAVPIAPRAGAFAVAPSEENLAKGLYQPLARPLFMYVRVKALERAGVGEFVQFTLANGARLAAKANYAPLAAETYRLGLEHLNRKTAGSAWGGSVPIGLSMQELQRRQAAM
jgi:phosphate transport system substrate-binding protein